MTYTHNLAAQIAADIRAEMRLCESNVPPAMDARLEAIIDGAMAGHNAKVKELVEALESFVVLYDQGQLALEGDDGNDPVIIGARAALFDLQA